MTSNEEKLHFDPIKEYRDWYVEEYQPPLPGYPFAMLNLILLEEKPDTAVAEEMEREVCRWTSRYAIPVMVSAFDQSGDPIQLSTERDSCHLTAIPEASSVSPKLAWRLLGNNEFPTDSYPNDQLKSVYADVPYRTSSDLREAAIQKAKQLRTGKLIVVFWLSIGPALLAIAEFVSPVWVAVIILAYTIYKAVIKFLKMIGKIEPSAAETEKSEHEAGMRHHHYHCEQNPEGFERLKVENFAKWGREEVQVEAARLRELQDRHEATPDD